MAEAILGGRLRTMGIDARVHSAGELPGGITATPDAGRTMRRRGLDLAGHRSRPVTVPMLAHADVVIGMARRHVRNAVVLDPGCFVRAFTLKELVRRGVDVGARRAGEPIADWLARLHAGRQLRDLLGDHPLDDVADPIGSALSVYEATANELDDLLSRMVELLFAGSERRESA